MVGRTDDTNQMLYDLSMFYKQILQKNEFISIKEEILILKRYLTLEAKCHTKPLIWEFAIDPAVENCIIPKFTLQPVIENCVKHAYSADKDELKIKMNMVATEGCVNIMIADNGRGMDDKELHQLYAVINETAYSNYHHGLKNMVDMLNIYWKENVTVEISSEKSKGTTVYLKLPYTKELPQESFYKAEP